VEELADATSIANRPRRNLLSRLDAPCHHRVLQIGGLARPERPRFACACSFLHHVTCRSLSQVSDRIVIRCLQLVAAVLACPAYRSGRKSKSDQAADASSSGRPLPSSEQVQPYSPPIFHTKQASLLCLLSQSNQSNTLHFVRLHYYTIISEYIASILQEVFLDVNF
jgi:hypothetical protein